MITHVAAFVVVSQLRVTGKILWPSAQHNHTSGHCHVLSDICLCTSELFMDLKH